MGQVSVARIRTGDCVKGFTDPVQVVGDRILLREFASTDCDAVQSYAGNPAVTRFTDWGPNTREATCNFLAETAKQREMDPRKAFDLAIIHTDTETLIGGASLRVVDADEREGEIGYVIHPSYWSLGYATEASKLLLQFGFERLGLGTIIATCDPENHASARVLRKAGFAFGKRIANHILVRGAWRDSLYFVAVDWRCRACGVDTDAIDEYFMLRDPIWDQVADGPGRHGHLCVGCVEDRLGRSLVGSDFTDADVNTTRLIKRSTRLAARLGEGRTHPQS